MSDIFRIDPFEDLEKVMNIYCKCLPILDEYGIYLTKLKAFAIFLDRWVKHLISSG